MDASTPLHKRYKRATILYHPAIPPLTIVKDPSIENSLRTVPAQQVVLYQLLEPFTIDLIH